MHFWMFHQSFFSPKNFLQWPMGGARWHNATNHLVFLIGLCPKFSHFPISIPAVLFCMLNPKYLPYSNDYYSVLFVRIKRDLPALNKPIQQNLTLRGTFPAGTGSGTIPETPAEKASLPLECPTASVITDVKKISLPRNPIPHCTCPRVNRDSSLVVLKLVSPVIDLLSYETVFSKKMCACVSSILHLQFQNLAIATISW